MSEKYPLRRLRETAGLSQRELAELLNISTEYVIHAEEVGNLERWSLVVKWYSVCGYELVEHRCVLSDGTSEGVGQHVVPLGHCVICNQISADPEALEQLTKHLMGRLIEAGGVEETEQVQQRIVDLMNHVRGLPAPFEARPALDGERVHRELRERADRYFELTGKMPDHHPVTRAEYEAFVAWASKLAESTQVQDRVDFVIQGPVKRIEVRQVSGQGAKSITLEQSPLRVIRPITWDELTRHRGHGDMRRPIGEKEASLLMDTIELMMRDAWGARHYASAKGLKEALAAMPDEGRDSDFE